LQHLLIQLAQSLHGFHVAQANVVRLEAGAIGNLLPGGRPVTDAAARVDIAAAWNTDSLPAEVGRSTSQIIDAVHAGQIGALVVGGVDPLDGDNSQAALTATGESFCCFA